jgi:hypothetical protein
VAAGYTAKRTARVVVVMYADRPSKLTVKTADP